MEDLKSLIKLISKQKVKQIEILTEDAVLSEKTKLLYEGIKESRFNSDDEASEFLYNEDSKNESFRKLKYRLKQRLINTLFFIDIQNYSKSNYEKALNRCYKNWAAYSILKQKGLKNASINLIESTLKTSLKYNITNLSLFILKDLKLHYSLFDSNNYKALKYNKLYSEIRTVYDLEEESEFVYTWLVKYVISSKAYTYNEEVENLEKQIYSLLKSSKNKDSYYLFFYLFNAAYLSNLIKKDVPEQLRICKEAIDYFSKKAEFGPLALFSFYQKKGLCLLQMNNYDEALTIFNYCFNFKPKEGGLAWQYLHNYIFTTFFLIENYEEAYKIVAKIISSRHFKDLHEIYKQPWYLKEAFCHFLFKVGRIEESIISEVKMRQFRISRFMNEISEFSKDKRGLNITINIIQMLFLIVDQEYDKVLDKLAALKQYNFRYLKRPEYIRSSTFIKMLLKIPEGNYDPSVFQKKTQSLLKILEDNPIDYSEQSMNIEILPYEVLWNELLHALKS